MPAIPDFWLGVWNGWVPLMVYAIGFLAALTTLSREERAWLFTDPKVHLRGPRKALLRAGQMVALGYIVAMVFAPVTVGSLRFALGLGLYLLGYVTVIASLRYFRRATPDKPAIDGPYRLSRNPQWVGLFLVLLGSALTCGSWLLLGMVLAVAATYHIQIVEEEKTCLARYGGSYAEYMKAVPRYLLFL